MHTHTYKVIFLSWWKFQSSRSRTMRSEHHLKIPQLWRIPAVKNIPTTQKKAWDTRIYSTRVIFTFVDYPHVFVHLFLRNTAFLLRQHTGWVWTNEVELGIWQNIDLKAMRSEPLKTKLKTLHFLRVDNASTSYEQQLPSSSGDWTPFLCTSHKKVYPFSEPKVVPISSVIKDSNNYWTARYGSL